MEKKRVHLIISGKVQGVFFRATTREKANEIGVKGYVRNKADGTVEVEAEGTQEGLEELIEFCKKGSKAARVDNVEVNYKKFMDEFDKFEVRY